MGLTKYPPTIAYGPTLSQLKKLIWRSIDTSPWEGLRGGRGLEIDIIVDYIPDQV